MATEFTKIQFERRTLEEKIVKEGKDVMTEERYKKMTPEEKRIWREKRKIPITPQTQGFYPKPGTGRENEVFERAATRRAAGTYVANY